MRARDSHVNVTLHKMAEKTKAPRWMPLEANPDVRTIAYGVWIHTFAFHILSSLSDPFQQ